jgi:putative transposase
MKRSKFTTENIVFALRQAEAGLGVEETCRKLGVSQARFFRWKSKYGELGTPEVRRRRLLQEENQKLEQLVADLSLDNRRTRDSSAALRSGLGAGTSAIGRRPLAPATR